MADQKKAAAATRKVAAQETAKRVADNSALPAASAGDIASAQKEGIKEAVKEAAKDTYQYLTDGNLAGEPQARQFTGMDEIMRHEGLLALGPDSLEKALDPKADVPIPEEKVAGLLSLERAGQNRTLHVQLLCKRLGVKSPYEVTNAGPAYTNDVTNVTPVTR